ncbi:MAG: response regulator transcription factor [SAR324 cluster bacterium]|uniref:Response regulator transcription factor n=1 Tax=SAR324 cluster bacterium TaxID=2024889 RepID=A0A7X9FUB1_9DELT|nr:response regulator transcription factor [SAR324 cluster bacterium]
MIKENLLIAVIDDDQSVSSGLRLNLELEGYKVICAADGEAGLDLVQKEHPDLIVLDVMMPKKDGLQLCKELRAAGISTPLILLTARNAEVDKVLGLDLGADDYLAKPFGMLELIARVKALLRRGTVTRKVERVEFSDVIIDFKAYQAKRQGEALELSAREFRLLQYLISKSDSVVTRDELLDEVWGYNSYPSTRTVDNHIARLRQKIEENSENPKHILTVHGVGYKFVA